MSPGSNCSRSSPPLPKLVVQYPKLNAYCDEFILVKDESDGLCFQGFFICYICPFGQTFRSQGEFHILLISLNKIVVSLVSRDEINRRAPSCYCSL